MSEYSPDGYPGVPPDFAQYAGALALDTGFIVGDNQLYQRGGWLVGWCIGEVAGTPALAAFEIRDGGGNGSRMIARVNIAASGMNAISFSSRPIRFQTSLFIHQVTGVATGGIYVIPND